MMGFYFYTISELAQWPLRLELFTTQRKRARDRV